MLKIIIADDERTIRESISHLIDWESLGLELVGQCKNGLEALDMILDETPDIVLTDIKMPGLTGVELVQRVSQTALNTQFILLSGYGEFSYAQEAMKYGVKHYLLKPSSQEQIVQTLREVIPECQRKKALTQVTQQQEEAIYNLQRGVLMNIIAEVTSDSISDFSALYAPHQKYMDFTYTDYLMCFLYDVERADLLDFYQKLLRFHRENAPGLPLHAIYVKNSLIIFSAGYPQAEEKIEKFMEDHAPTRSPYTRELRHFHSLAALLDEILLYTQHYSTIFYVSPTKLISVSNFQNILSTVKDCCAFICQVLTDRPEDEVEKIRGALNRLSATLSRVENPDYLRILASTILFTLSDRDLCCTHIETAEIVQKLYRYEDAAVIRDKLLSFLGEVLPNPNSNSLQGKLVQQIKDYVSSNLSDPNLTLKLIAETYLYMNVDYVSKRFLKEAGCRFSTYLTEMRVQKAAQLLASGDGSKIQTIAEQVGCGNNPQYFSQVFKKSTGMTPSAYARSIRGI